MGYIAVILLLLSGPVLANDQSWVGKSEQALIEDKGLPEQSMSTDQGKIYQYKNCQVFVLPRIGNAPPPTPTLCHHTMFYITGGVITRVQKKRG